MNLCPPYCPCLVHPLCIVWWKPGCPCVSLCLCPSHLISVPHTLCISTWIYVHLAAYVWSTMHSLMETWVPLYGSCLCPSHLISVATPVHEFMSTLHPMSGPPPMDSYMESWVPLCVTACVSQSPYFCCYTLFRMCTCISTWIYVHLAAYVWSTPMHSLMETWVPLYGSVFVSQSSHFCCHTLFRMCTCISTWIYVYLTPHVWSTPYG